MPYDPDNPPDKVSKLSPKKQRQWVHVFNSCHKGGGDEAKCHAQAWGTVKKTASLEDAIVLLERLVMGCDCEDSEEEDDVSYLDVGVHPKDSEGCGCDSVGDCGCKQTHSEVPPVIAGRIVERMLRRTGMNHGEKTVGRGNGVR